MVAKSRKRSKMFYFLLVLLGLCVCAIPFRSKLRRPVVAFTQNMKNKKTISDRIDQYGEVVRARLSVDFDKTEVEYPPRKLTLVGLKNEKVLQVWAMGTKREWRHLKDYPILKMSGTLGPKLQEGDLQAPEGLTKCPSC